MTASYPENAPKVWSFAFTVRQIAALSGAVGMLTLGRVEFVEGASAVQSEDTVTLYVST